MVLRQTEAAEQTQAMCRQWYQDEIVERYRELLARSRQQELMDKERYQELSAHFKEEKTKNAELRKTLAALQSRRTPNPWGN
eukprot:7250462-Prorocentrum_lima.AAC.1